MQLTCTVTRNDVVAWFDYVGEHTPARRQMLRRSRIFTGLFYGLICALSFIVFYGFFQRSIPFVIASSAVVLAIVGGFVYGYLAPIDASGRIVVAQMEQNQDLATMLGAKTIVVKPDVYECNAAQAATSVHWSAVRKIVETETHLFVLYSAASACIIPKASAIPAEEVPAFVAAAKAAWAQVHAEESK